MLNDLLEKLHRCILILCKIGICYYHCKVILVETNIFLRLVLTILKQKWAFFSISNKLKQIFFTVPTHLTICRLGNWWSSCFTSNCVSRFIWLVANFSTTRVTIISRPRCFSIATVSTKTVRACEDVCIQTLVSSWLIQISKAAFIFQGTIYFSQ